MKRKIPTQTKTLNEPHKQSGGNHTYSKVNENPFSFQPTTFSKESLNNSFEYHSNEFALDNNLLISINSDFEHSIPKIAKLDSRGNTKNFLNDQNELKHIRIASTAEETDFLINHQYLNIVNSDWASISNMEFSKIYLNENPCTAWLEDKIKRSKKNGWAIFTGSAENNKWLNHILFKWWKNEDIVKNDKTIPAELMTWVKQEMLKKVNKEQPARYVNKNFSVTSNWDDKIRDIKFPLLNSILIYKIDSTLDANSEDINNDTNMNNDNINWNCDLEKPIEPKAIEIKETKIDKQEVIIKPKELKTHDLANHRMILEAMINKKNKDNKSISSSNDKTNVCHPPVLQNQEEQPLVGRFNAQPSFNNVQESWCLQNNQPNPYFCSNFKDFSMTSQTDVNNFYVNINEENVNLTSNTTNTNLISEFNDDSYDQMYQKHLDEIFDFYKP